MSKPTIEKAKRLYQKLKKDDASILFWKETLSNNLFRKLKRYKYSKEKEFVNLIIELEITFLKKRSNIQNDIM